jgi:hypothetical protein
MDQAASLTAAVRCSIAAQILEVHRVLHAAKMLLPLDRIAHLIGALIDSELPTAELEHLRHEGQGFQRAV